jgi:hypothetical protein
VTDRPHWTTLNLAALWLAVVAAENQRTGLTSMPDVDGAGSPLGHLLTATDGGVLDEPEVLEAAVVLERVAGAAWDQLAVVLRTTPEELERRFAPVERSFRLAEAFPGMLHDTGSVPAGAAVLRFPDASRRWLVTALTRRGAPEPRLAVDDATWRRHEEQAVEFMQRTLDAGDLPDQVDLLTARFDVEHRRVGLLVAGTAEEPPPSRHVVAAIERGVRACDDLSLWVQRRSDGTSQVVA